MAAGFTTRKRAPDPYAEGVAEIVAWGQWFVRAHEDMLRDDPDIHLHAQKRAQAKAIADARMAELRADLLARSQR